MSDCFDFLKSNIYGSGDDDRGIKRKMENLDWGPLLAAIQKDMGIEPEPKKPKIPTPIERYSYWTRNYEKFNELKKNNPELLTYMGKMIIAFQSFDTSYRYNMRYRKSNLAFEEEGDFDFFESSMRDLLEYLENTGCKQTLSDQTE